MISASRKTASTRSQLWSIEMKKSGGLLLVQVEVDPAVEDDLHHWYEDEHIAERLSVPGFLRVRRYRSVGEDRKFLALYDLKSPEVLNTPEYRHFKEQGGELQELYQDIL
jgi:hypothetical protein